MNGTRARLVLALAVMGLISTACGAATVSESEEPNDSSAPVESDGESSDAAVTVVLPEEPTDLEPGNYGLDVTRVARNVLEALVNRDPTTGEIVPELATAWERVDDLTWQFTLREDVTFHNGEPFNAGAAAFGVNRAVDPALELLVAQVLVPMQATAISEYTLEIVTEEPQPILPNLLYYVLLPEPTATADQVGIRDPIGTGPYELTEFAGGERIVLTRFDGYWGDAPDVQTAEFVWRDDATVRLGMVEAGEAVIAASISPEGADPALVKSVVIPETPFYRPESACPAMADVRVRQAIDAAIDRQTIVDQLYAGYAEPAGQIITSDVTGFNEDLAATEFDPDRARALLEEAAADGVPIDTELTLIARPGFFANSIEVNEVVSAMLNDVGLVTRVESMEANAWLDAILLKPIPDDRCALIQSSLGNEVGDAAPTIRIFYTTEGPPSACCNAEIDAMAADAANLEGEERDAAFEEIILTATEEEVSPIPLFHLQALYAVSDEVSWEPRFDQIISVKDIQLP
jgi:peptide/nickel transport system substrate-binding protein